MTEMFTVSQHVNKLQHESRAAQILTEGKIEKSLKAWTTEFVVQTETEAGADKTPESKTKTDLSLTLLSVVKYKKLNKFIAQIVFCSSCKFAKTTKSNF